MSKQVLFWDVGLFATRRQGCFVFVNLLLKNNLSGLPVPRRVRYFTAGCMVYGDRPAVTHSGASPLALVGNDIGGR
jgi:hypothetical protein